MSKFVFPHIKSGGYFRRRVVLSGARTAGLSILPKVEIEDIGQASNLEARRELRYDSSEEGKLDFSSDSDQFLQ